VGKNEPCIAILNKNVILFFFYKIAEQEGETSPVWGRGIGTSGSRENVEKGCRKGSILQILCTHVCKWKMIPVETTPGMEWRWIKENYIFDTL
jgi:hypothetical protein